MNKKTNIFAIKYSNRAIQEIAQRMAISFNYKWLDEEKPLFQENVLCPGYLTFDPLNKTMIYGNNINWFNENVNTSVDNNEDLLLLFKNPPVVIKEMKYNDFTTLYSNGDVTITLPIYFSMNGFEDMLLQRKNLME